MTSLLTVLVTGGAGFIGSHTVKRLVTDGYKVIIVDNFNSYYDPALKNARLNIFLKETPHTLYRKSLEDTEALHDIFKHHKIDFICHQAAQAGVRYAAKAPLVYGNSNLIGTINILEMAKTYGVKGVVIASSSSVYGDATHFPIKEEDVTDKPISLYAATKRSCELIAHSYHHLYQIPITCLRYFTVYGPWGRPDMALFSFTEKALNHKPIEVYGQGNMARDFTYVDDIVDGIVRAIALNAPFEILNLGRGKPEELLDMIKLIERYTKKTIEKTFLDMQPGDVAKTWADNTKAKALLGWEPHIYLEEGVKRFVDWYREYYNV